MNKEKQPLRPSFVSRRTVGRRIITVVGMMPTNVPEGTENIIIKCGVAVFTPNREATDLYKQGRDVAFGRAVKYNPAEPDRFSFTAKVGFKLKQQFEAAVNEFIAEHSPKPSQFVLDIDKCKTADEVDSYRVAGPIFLD